MYAAPVTRGRFMMQLCSSSFIIIKKLALLGHGRLSAYYIIGTHSLLSTGVIWQMAVGTSLHLTRRERHLTRRESA